MLATKYEYSVKCTYFIFTYRYLAIMTPCWIESPDDRPNFSSIVTTIDELLTSMAGYLDFNAFNLAVTTQYSDTKTPNDTEDEAED